MHKVKQVSFGVQVGEEEVKALASFFVETNEWIRIARGILFGERKGRDG